MKNQGSKTRKRSKRSKKKKNITIFYSNINGVKSKYGSLQNIIEKAEPNIIALCETKVGKSSKLEKILPQYKLFPKPVKLGKGGLLIGIKKNMFKSQLDVSSSASDNILAVRLSVSDKLILRLILVYGPQETESLETETIVYDRRVSGVIELQG